MPGTGNEKPDPSGADRKVYECTTCMEYLPRRGYSGSNAKSCNRCTLENNSAKKLLAAIDNRHLAVEKRKERRAFKKEKTRTRQARRKRIKQQAKKEVQAERSAAKTLMKQTKKVNLAEREIAARILASRRLLPFIMRMKPDYIPGWVHKDICIRLEKFAQDIADGKSPRLMLQMPPRHGKSEIASINFPAWYLGLQPKHEVISCSYSGSLALGFSRKVRGVIREPLYTKVFPKTVLDKDNQNAEGWMTGKGGGYTPAGTGGPITGKGANLLIIDDPVKNSEEAESQTARENLKDWYSSTAYTRLAPGGGVLVIQTRWHDDDLSGWLERQESEGKGDTWEIVRYPAEATADETYRRKGDPLHAARYPIDALKRIKRAVGPRVWQSLYQQNPVAEDGEYFRKDMFRWYDGAAAMRYKMVPMRIYSAWDFAIGKGDRNDWTVGITVGVDSEDNMWVLDMRRGRWDTFEIVENLLSVHRTFRPDTIGLERGQLSMAIGPYLQKRIREEKLWDMNIKDLPTGRRDKEARARAIQGRMQQGRVHFPKDEEWCDILSQEMLRFPNGVHDDCVDALAWVGLMLQDMIVPAIARTPDPLQKGWKKKLRGVVTSSRSRGGHMTA